MVTGDMHEPTNDKQAIDNDIQSSPSRILAFADENGRPLTETREYALDTSEMNSLVLTTSSSPNANCCILS